VKGTTKQELANLMVGREVFFDLQKEEQTPGDIVLEVENLKAENDKGLHALKGLSINVRSGEIVGLAGVAGNGQAELAEVITGLRAPTGGRVIVHGETLIGEGAETKNEAQSVRKIIDARVSHIPEDRTHVGTAPNLSITDNVIMKNYRVSPISKRWSVDKIEARQYAESLKDSYDIIVPTVETQARLLSGGNLQRLILAREMSSEPDLMIAMQPTRGLDVGAIEGVQRLLLEQRKNGAAILLVSEELEELIALSDRVYAIYEGEIMGEMADADAETLGLMMTGTPLSEIAKEKEVQG
jgi:simple sugar transport system ATP-binding protein